METIIKNGKIPETCSSCPACEPVVGGMFCPHAGKNGTRMGVTVACYERLKNCPLTKKREQE